MGDNFVHALDAGHPEWLDRGNGFCLEPQPGINPAVSAWDLDAQEGWIVIVMPGEFAAGRVPAGSRVGEVRANRFSLMSMVRNHHLRPISSFDQASTSVFKNTAGANKFLRLTCRTICIIGKYHPGFKWQKSYPQSYFYRHGVYLLYPIHRTCPIPQNVIRLSPR